LQTYTLPHRFPRALKLIRGALAGMDLEIAGEFGNGDPRPSRTLLVDCPLLMFEALALDRAAAVFFPLHVLVAANGDSTEVSIVDPARLLQARLPIGSADPLDRLVGRIELALESLSRQPSARSVAGEHGE
jgi:Domain of unknown function DUF302